jgi:signal transduction histidine kinase
LTHWERARGSRSRAQHAGSQILFTPATGVVGTWDRFRLGQVVSNLIDNALKYGAGKPIEVRVGKDEHHAKLEVVDHGIGIAPADQARVFERFERAVSVRNYGGLGLGLWIVRSIVKAHRGEIVVRSAPGEGSTFTVTLPI